MSSTETKITEATRALLQMIHNIAKENENLRTEMKTMQEKISNLEASNQKMREGWKGLYDVGHKNMYWESFRTSFFVSQYEALNSLWT